MFSTLHQDGDTIGALPYTQLIEYLLNKLSRMNV